MLRLIEYLVEPGGDIAEILRPSLIGSIRFGWGSLTATVVDSCDARQEDLLGLARKQPGVWLSNPDAMRQAPRHEAPAQRPLRLSRQIFLPPQETSPMEPTPTPPPTGPLYSAEEQQCATRIIELGGYRLAYTLALALQAVLPELDTNAEPERLYHADEALRLANALMANIPPEWQPEVEEAAEENEPAEPVAEGRPETAPGKPLAGPSHVR